MKKIAILTCLNACQGCTGAACMDAWNNRTVGFAMYREQDALLSAFLHCNGCGSDPETDPGMIRKLDRLQSEGITVVHTGICTITDKVDHRYCPSIEKIISMLKDRGIETIYGTHRF